MLISHYDDRRTLTLTHPQGSLEDLCVVDYILADPLLKDLPRGDVVHALDVVGFTDQMKEGSITSLSGGEMCVC
jgi:hypothetical protein